MIRVYLLVFIIIAFFWYKAFLQKTSQERKRYIRKSTLISLIVCFILLAAMGRLNWIFAVLGVGVATVTRFLPVVLRYAPQLQRLWKWLLISGFFSKETHGGTSSAQSSAMSLDEACKVLGVSISATRQEIIDAHRKLILKNHPDKGGSSYLAAQINQAKDLLLKNK